MSESNLFYAYLSLPVQLTGTLQLNFDLVSTQFVLLLSVSQAAMPAAVCSNYLQEGVWALGKGLGIHTSIKLAEILVRFYMQKKLYNFFWYISSSKTLPKKLDCCLCNCEAKRDSENFFGGGKENLWNDSWQNDSSAVLAFRFRKPWSQFCSHIIR